MNYRSLALIILLCISLGFSSCTPELDDIQDDPVPPAVPDSIYVLSKFQNEFFGGGRTCEYDASSRLIMTYVYYNSSNFDTNFFRYNSNRTLKSVVNVQRAVATQNLRQYTPTIFVYDGQNKLSKVIHKPSTYQWNETYFDSYSNRQEYSSYDSLAYDNANRITSVYSYGVNNGVTQYLNRKLRLQYPNLTDSVISQAEELSFHQDGSQWSSEFVKFNSYDTVVNPFYRDLRYNHFISLGSYDDFIPIPNAATYLLSILSLSPRNCTNITVYDNWGNVSYNGPISFFYNSNNLPSYITPNQIHYFRYYYRKVKK